LIHETSPYLLQHAHNPVDWQPWGETALAQARALDKPILLSIGYSACHWCHVMEHESFEDEAVARVMNELFVCIKVDREERPDLDKIYQTAHQILTQRPGGWPLNMFLMPTDHMPFFGGTYFPKTPRYGMSGFVDLLQRVARAYREQRESIERQNDSVRDVFRRLEPAAPVPGVHIAPAVLTQALDELKHQFDTRYGGFGSAPKFPHPTSLEFCLRAYARSVSAGQADATARHMVHASLTAMARGGLYDQLGGGFCRYSVDAQWIIPHFEKMLYDNAQLLGLYADAALALDEALFRRIACDTGAWVMREMQAPGGGYYSTLDADSEGHEGKFYAWSIDEIARLLTPEEWNVVEAVFGLAGEPNFEGRWHLNVHADSAAVAGGLQRPEAEVNALIESARAKLFAARAQRVPPGRDEKILTSWNGLMIKAMAHAGRLLNEPEFVHSAERAFDFVRATLWRNGRLLATTKDGKTHLNAYLDDYVFLMDAGLELLQARWRDDDLAFVRALADVVLEHFEDENHGGFFFTADDHEPLLQRPKPASDDAIPAGNGVAALTFARLGHLLGDSNYLKAAERTLEALYGAVLSYPSAHGALLRAIEEYLYPTETIVLRGEAAALAEWLERSRRRYAPRRLTVAIPENAAALPGVLAQRPAVGGITAYVCAGHSCQAPVRTRADFEQLLIPGEFPAAGPA
jgi:hypothetical protein